MGLTAVSLFAGVEGFGLAMERSGINVVASVEIDNAARGVIERHFPTSKIFNDVKEVTGEQLRDAGFIPDRGVLVGGFPCQDLSVAGKRAGLVGKRSGLYWEIVRLIDELSPKWLVLENVPGLLSSHGGRDFGAVLGSLVERGYGVAYRVLDAQYFGVPQRRRRVFIVGCLGDDGRTPFEILALGQGVSGDSSSRTAKREDIANALTTGFGSGGPDDNAAQSRHLVEVAPTLASHHQRHNASDEVLIAHTLTAGATGRAGRRQEDDADIVTHALTSEGFDASEDGTGRGVPLVPFVKIVRSGARDEDGNLPAEQWAERDLAPTLNAMDNTGDSRATVLAFHQTQDPISGDVAPALGVSSCGMGIMEAVRSHPRPGSATPGLTTVQGLEVRRLTPTECERLQGFPDGWTDGQSDSARYRQMGNAVAVPVAEWIMRQLVEVDRA